MKFEIDRIMLAEKANPPKIEVVVSFKDDKKFCSQTGTLRVYLEYKDYTVSEIKTEAVKAAKEFLSDALKQDTEEDFTDAKSVVENTGGLNITEPTNKI